MTASYSFTEGTGTTTADASGNNLTGTLTNGTTWTAGSVGNGLSFDGIDDFVNLGNPTQLQLTGSMTISAWIFATGAPPANDDAAVVSKRTSGFGGYQLDTTPDTGTRTIGFKLTSSAGASMARYGATTLQLNQWYHLTGVYDAATSSMHVYLNGVLNDGRLVGTVTASQQNSPANVNIGRRPDSAGVFEFKGKIDEVRIFGRALTPAEVQTLYGGAPATSPTVTINQAASQGDPTNAAAVNFTVIFSEAVTGFATGDVTLGGTAGATTATVTGSGTTYNVAVSGMSQTGTVIATIAGGVAIDAAGNANTASTSTDNAVTHDNGPPSVTIDQAAGQTDPTSAATISYTVIFSESVTGFVTGDVTLGGTAGATTATVTGSGTTYNVAVSGMTQSGSVVATIAAGVATDAAGNANIVSTSTDNTVSNNIPAVPESVAAYSFEEGTGATTADASDNGLTGTLTNGPAWTAGKVGGALSFDGVNDFVDLGNPAPLQLTGSMSISSWILSVEPPSNNDDAVVVSKRASAGFQLDTTLDTGSRTIGFKLTNSSGSSVIRYGATPLQNDQWYHIVGVYDATARVMHVYLNGALDDGIQVGTVTASQQNSANNVNIGRRPDNARSFEFNGKIDEVRIFGRAITSAEIQTLYGGGDTTPPSVTINQDASQGDPTNAATVTFTAVFSEAVTGFSTGDVTLGGTAGATTAVVTGNGTTYSVAVSGMTQSGTVVASIAAGAASDLAGNTNTASTSTDNTVTFNVADTTPPSVTINQASGQADPSNASVINFTVVFSVAVANFATGDVTLGGTAGASAVNVTGSGTTFTAAVSGMTQSGTVTVTIAAGVATDAAGNPNTASTSTDSTVTYDNGRPSVTINQAAAQGDPTSSGTITYTVVFTEAVTGFATGDLTPGGTAGATTATVSGSGSTYTVAITGMTQPGTVTATIPAGVALDAAGNTNTASTSTDNIVAYEAPATPAGAVAIYSFEEGTGTTTADSSGNNLTGALTNGTAWTTGNAGNGLSFDGVDDFVDLGNPTQLRLTGSMTISAWIFPDGPSPINDDATVVSKRSGARTGYQLDTTPDTGSRTIGFKLTNSAGSNTIRYGSTTLQDNQWYHVVGVYDAPNQAMHVYVNGFLDDGGLVGTVTSSQMNSTMNVNIGRRPGNPGDFEFNGKIDEVSLYNRPLAPGEIFDLYNAGVSGDASVPQSTVTFPLGGSSVAGIITLTADATDDSGNVSGVQFFVDGVAAGPEDTTAPHAISWDSRTVANGAHSFTAVARDAAGHVGVSNPVTATVFNTDFFVNDVLVTGLNLPTTIKFLPDGRMLIGELGGTIHILQPGSTQVESTPFMQLTNIGTQNSQQGLMDLVLDPDFANNRYLYVFYTLGSPNRDRVSRFTANGSTAGNELVLWQDAEDASTEHHGGALNFANDGKLYITTGEHFNATEAQDLTNYRGKILRINKDGTIPTDNPFFDGNGPNRDAVWALGLRNPYRASYDSVSGMFLIGDVGGNDYSVAKEEVNLGIRGANYGWPNCEGTCANPKYTNPIYSYPHNGRDASITAGFIYRGSQFPSQYYGSYFFADYTQNWIRRLTLDAAGTVTGVFNFEPIDGSVDGPYGDIVYLTEGPDGALYYVDLGFSDIGGIFGLSKIRRIRYIAGNQPPVAAAAANPVTGQAPLSVTFSSAGSSDPEGQPLAFNWDFGDGSSSTAANPTHDYTSAGQYTARLSVSDGTQSTLASSIIIRVGNRPTVTLLSPETGSFFRAGQAIAFRAEATDVEDGTLPASAYSWRINLRHSEHIHPALPQDGVDAGTFLIPTSGHDFSGDVYYEFIVTVTDTSGLQSSASALIYPEKTALSFDSLPSGLTITVDGIPHTTPFSFDTLMLFEHVVNAPTQALGSTTYNFASWSDGGGQQHTLVAPVSNQSYVATFTAGATVPLAGLAARYEFEEAAGTTIADLSGNNNTGALSAGAIWAAGKSGSGINLDGASGQAVIPNSSSLDLAGSFTLAGWINPDTLTGFQTILIKEESAMCGYWLQTVGNQISSGFRPASGGCIDHQTTTADLTAGNWYHVAAVLDRGTNTFQIYLNGVSILTDAETAAPAPNNESLVLGRTHVNEAWNGTLDDVRIYSRALSAGEILQMMQGVP